MKNLIIAAFILIGINTNAQEKKVIRKLLPQGSREGAVIHDGCAYDTLSFFVIKEYGFNQDAYTGEWDDKYDTIYIQRKVDINLGYYPERGKACYKLLYTK